MGTKNYNKWRNYSFYYYYIQSQKSLDLSCNKTRPVIKRQRSQTTSDYNPEYEWLQARLWVTASDYKSD